MALETFGQPSGTVRRPCHSAGSSPPHHLMMLMPDGTSCSGADGLGFASGTLGSGENDCGSFSCAVVHALMIS